MTDDQIQSAIRALADRARPARAGLADTVLRRARRRRYAARASVAGSSLLAVTAAASLAFAAPWNAPSDGRTLAPAGTASPDVPREKPATPRDQHCVLEKGTPSTVPEDCSESPPPDDSPKPPKLDPLPDDARQLAALQVNDTWYLADRETGELTASDWSWVSVSPDGEEYAVLEKNRSDRIGILDRASGEVEHWISTENGVGQVYWSPSDDVLVGTVYEKSSDPYDLPTRKGFVLAHADDPVASYPVELDFQGGHVDYSWSNAVFWNGDGSGLVASYAHDHEMRLGIRLLSLDGEVEKTLPDTGALTPANGIATSPDNRYAMTEPNKTKNHVIDLETGELVENTRSFGAEAWLDNDQFIGDLAWSEITGELAVIETDGDVVDRLWKAPKDVVVDALAVSRD